MSIYKEYGIYGIKNIINDKIYIGKTINNFGDRWDCHRGQLRGGYHNNPKLQEEWKQYGEDAFQFQIIHNCTGKILEEINNLEIQEIKKYKDMGLAYNIHDGGDTGLYLGKHLSEETKRKIGEKNRINMLGRKASESTKIKMRESQKQRYTLWSEEDRKAWGRKMSKAQIGISKPKLSQKMKNNKNGAKYTVEQVREIRRLYEIENKNYTEISKIMNIPRATVYLIATYRRWKEI